MKRYWKIIVVFSLFITLAIFQNFTSVNSGPSTATLSNKHFWCNTNNKLNTIQVCSSQLDKQTMQDMGWSVVTNNCFHRATPQVCTGSEEVLSKTVSKNITCNSAGFFEEVSCNNNSTPAAPWLAVINQPGCYKLATDIRCVPAVHKAACSQEKLNEIKAPATAEESAVKLDCSLDLSPSDIITKLLIINERGSGVRLNCNGAKIVRSPHSIYSLLITSSYKSGRQNKQDWSRPQGVTIENCNINGMVMVRGMSKNGEGEIVKDPATGELFNAYKESSVFDTNHSWRAKQNAPRDIVFSKLKISGIGPIPLYISPGVTYLRMYDSELLGKSNSVGMYLDAESGNNIFKNNYFHVDTTNSLTEVWRWREQVAVDGSAYNRFLNNRFSSLNNGGIFFYRNCGENGVVRHQTPYGNRVINNAFYYLNFDRDLNHQYENCDQELIGGLDYIDPICYTERLVSRPTIWMGSRNGNKPYCGLDAGYPFGSSASDGDFANGNIIAQNAIFKLDPQVAVRDHSSKNLSVGNYPVDPLKYEGISSFPLYKPGCYLQGAYPKSFLNHGQSTSLLLRNNVPTCVGYQYTCNAGVLEPTAITCPTTTPAYQVVDFECRASGSNGGCAKTVSCPAGTQIISSKIACNLEFGSVEPSYLNNMDWNILNVIRASDYINHGRCQIDHQKISAGSRSLNDQGKGQLFTSCAEWDKNGGDCHILGQLLCGAPVSSKIDLTKEAWVYRFFKYGWYHLFTTSYQEGINLGATKEPNGFRVFKEPLANGTTVPIYRCNNSGYIFGSLDSACEGKKYEGIYGHIYKTQLGQTRPLYRFSKGYDRLMTVDYFEGAIHGYAYEGVLGFVTY